MLVATATALAGCQAPRGDEAISYTAADRIYTCSYDSSVVALEDVSEPRKQWRNDNFTRQTRDVLPDRENNLLVADNRGLHKLAQFETGLSHEWRYGQIGGSVRGIAIDRDNDYYVGSWTAGQGFHKVVKTPNGEPEQAWVYRWPDDTGMITAAADMQKRLALALKNGMVHLVRERNGEPEPVWTWSPGTDEIVREVLWDESGHLYVGSEDHHLYKLRETDEGAPEVVWSYDAGTILYGAAITPGNEIYVATNAGEIHALVDTGEEVQERWRYRHTTYEGTAPTDEYFWGGLVHQVAVRPEPDETAIYSCAYGENTVHRIADVDGQPELVWEYTPHADHVREVRVHGEYVGTTPEAWSGN